MSFLLNLTSLVILRLKFKFDFFGLIHLSLLPLIVFNELPLTYFLLSLILAWLLFLIYQKPSLLYFCLFLLAISFSFFIVHPKLGLDPNLVNSINTQRGEHPNYQTNLISKILHNKTDLFHSFIKNVDLLLSPKAIFAAGYWKNLSVYYPLSLLFPWDLFLILKKFKKGFRTKPQNHWPITLSLFFLIMLSGLLSLESARLYSIGLIYFLALLSAEELKSLPSKFKYGIIVLDLLLIGYQAYVTPFFRL